MDRVDNTTRSKIMAAVRSKGNISTEIAMVSVLRKEQLTGWRRHLALIGKPDFSWKGIKVVLFVDGCFWHGCKKCSRMPKSNIEYWNKKIADNISRDRKINRKLRSLGWSVIRVWECKINLKITSKRIRKTLENRGWRAVKQAIN